MGFKIRLGSGDEREHHAAYGRIDTYNEPEQRRARSMMDDMEHEMRRGRAMLDDMDHELRRRRAALEDMEHEMRRGRRSSSQKDTHYPMDTMEEMRRRRAAMDDTYPVPYGEEREEHPHDARRIGFYAPGMHGDYDAPQESAVQGMAKFLPLDPRLDAVLEDATKVLKNVPETWKPYLKTHDYAGIVRMEGKELLQALEQGKSMKDVRKELMHTLAAMFQSLIK